MQRYNNLTHLPHDNFVKTLTISEVSNVEDGKYREIETFPAKQIVD